jgi:excisionase family DNA binding protein
MTQQDTRPKESIRLLVTVDEAASRLGIGRSHIYQQMRRGALRSLLIGRSRRILEQDLNEFIATLLEDGGARSIAPKRLPPTTPVKRIAPRPGRR